ncbi:MAG: hypothetical protein KGL36_01990, partial [Gammaproteobacteria bacterium]|nr:hypothetical protein [Gammaproteobacteria bacterium]
MNQTSPGLALALVIAIGTGAAARPATAAAGAIPTPLLQADAGLAAAVNAANADAWVAFYDPRVIARLPRVGLVEGKAAAHRAATRLLAQRIDSFRWTPARWTLSASGRLAYVDGAYALRVDGSRALLRGERVEIWRERRAGGWDCLLDAWNPPRVQVAQGAPVAPVAPVAPAAPAAPVAPAGPGAASAPTPP